MFSLNQKVSLVMLATADFMSFCSMSIMAPFYPKEAASKGMSESMSGFIFGYYALVVFLSSPIFGKIVRIPLQLFPLETNNLLPVTKNRRQIPVYKRPSSIGNVQRLFRVSEPSDSSSFHFIRFKIFSAPLTISKTTTSSLASPSL